MQIHNGQVMATPQEVGFRPEAITKLDAFFMDCVENTPIQAASYLLARRGKVFVWNSVGKLSGLEDNGDFLPDSLFGIASITKTLTAVGIMQLMEQGKLALEQPVATVLPEFQTKMHEGITMMHLLTHTSGLPADPGAHTEPYPRAWWTPELNKDNWITWALQGPLQYPTGTVWNYCSKGFWLLGEIIARVSGMSYPEYIQRHILDPLGMTRSFFLVPKALRDQVVIVNEFDLKELHEEPNDNFSPSWCAGGGLSSTPFDLWKFAQMLLNKGTFNGQRILGRKTVEAMTRNQLDRVPDYTWGHNIKAKPFGFGLEVDKDPVTSPGTFGHEGARWSSMFIDPVEELICIYFQPTVYEFWQARYMNGARAIAWGGIE
ncbi:beta-lactamase [Candidatus Moduliflexus flocculans]|uniref:Beta-lactamase n=1 Tax=Candidatus Moduliflexus flocculans TaxID=1499966 RepID=A0A0S6W533_9BACT|nr:beta-lactamase [Candidatus Moduliflexus flocculans]